MAPENSGWGAPKIHGELLKLGFEVSERTVARYLKGMRGGAAILGGVGLPSSRFIAN
jgi:hypothetical protein